MFENINKNEKIAEKKDIKIEQIDNKNFTAVCYIYNKLGDFNIDNINDNKSFDELENKINEENIDISIFRNYNFEIIEWLSFCIDDEDKLNKLKNNQELLKGKNITEDYIDEVYSKVKDTIKQIAEYVPDIKQKEEINFNERLKKINNFFKFKDINIQNIEIVLDNPFRGKEDGSCINLGDEIIISTNTENIDNFDHEFLHTQLNSMIDNLQMDDDFINIINGMLKFEKSNIKEYGELSMQNRSALYEEFIRTYVNYFSKGEDLIEQVKEIKNIKNVDDEEFKEYLKNKVKESGKIFSEEELEEAMQKIDKEKYIESSIKEKELQTRIYAFYKEYSMQSDKNFEEYINEFPGYIKRTV